VPASACSQHIGPLNRSGVSGDRSLNDMMRRPVAFFEENVAS
jgi:hypothetical protein